MERHFQTSDEEILQFAKCEDCIECGPAPTEAELRRIQMQVTSSPMFQSVIQKPFIYFEGGVQNRNASVAVWTWSWTLAFEKNGRMAGTPRQWNLATMETLIDISKKSDSTFDRDKELLHMEI